MTLKEIKNRLQILSNKGFVRSRRRGATGIGHTLEQELGLIENNLAIPDIGGRVELKASRANSASMITLFTFNRAVWKIPQKTIIEKYGYIDNKGRKALYSTVTTIQSNPQGLIVKIDRKANNIHLISTESNEILATWSLYTIVGKLLNKLDKLIFVIALSRLNEITGYEEFHFIKAYLLQLPSIDSFLNAFDEGAIAIDIRMHINENKYVRNHGTGFRIKEKDLILLYDTKTEIIND